MIDAFSHAPKAVQDAVLMPRVEGGASSSTGSNNNNSSSSRCQVVPRVMGCQMGMKCLEALLMIHKRRHRLRPAAVVVDRRYRRWALPRAATKRRHCRTFFWRAYSRAETLPNRFHGKKQCMPADDIDFDDELALDDHLRGQVVAQVRVGVAALSCRWT